jgi:predicted RNA-binding protein YlqC (UPF0109 family)
MKNLLAEIVLELVDYPEQVKVKEIDGGHTVVLELSVAKQDIGKIIGKKGQNIEAIRTVINAASGKMHKRIIVEVLE